MHKLIKSSMFAFFLIAIFSLSGNASAAPVTLSFFEHPTFSTFHPEMMACTALSMI